MNRGLCIITLIFALFLTAGIDSPAAETYQIGGYTYAHLTHGEDDKVNKNVSFWPSIETQVRKDLMLGIGFGIGGDDGGYKRFYYSISPYIKHYSKIDKNISFFLKFDAHYRQDFEGENLPQTENVFGVRLSPGLSFIITKDFLLEATIGSIYYNFNKDFGLGLNQIGLGIVYKFKK